MSAVTEAHAESAAQNEDGRLAYRPREFAKATGFSPAGIYKEIYEGRLRAIRKGRALLILRQDALDWLSDAEPAA